MSFQLKAAVTRKGQSLLLGKEKREKQNCRDLYENILFVNEMVGEITDFLDLLCIEEIKRADFIRTLLGQTTCRTGTALNVVT